MFDPPKPQAQIIHELENTVRVLQQQEVSLKEERQQLKQMVVNGSNDNDEPIENKLIRAFAALRDKIQIIASKVMQSHRDKVQVPVASTPERVVGLYRKDWSNAPGDAARKLRMRARLFLDLKEQVLDKPCFGAPRILERNLGRFETILCKNEKGEKVALRGDLRFDG